MSGLTDNHRGLCFAIGRTEPVSEAGASSGAHGIHALFRGKSLGIFTCGLGDSAGGVKSAAEFTYVLEGEIYSCTRSRLEQLLGEALGAQSFARCEALVRSFVAREDGEFLVAAEHRQTGRCLAFNDSLGRLPLFSKTGEGWIVLGRSLAATSAFCGTGRPDRMGIASRLLFGYPLDRRTEQEGIEGFPESGLVWLDSPAGTPMVSAGTVDYGGASVGSGDSRGFTQRDVEGLGAGLIAACDRRVRSLPDLTPTLALSGGFDSRLVACALRKTGVLVDAITRTDYLSASADARVAAQVAKTLGIRHHAVACGELNPRLVMELAEISDGCLGTGLAHMLGFLEHARDRLGSARFLLTGDGGDKTIAPLLPLGRLTHRGEVDRLMDSFSRADLEACRTITGLSESEIRDYVGQSFRNQPGQTAAEKSRALAFRQRARRWLSLGEDRNRSVFWSTSPFYAPEFFALSNRISDAAKQRDRLYLRLLGWFDERMARIPRPGLGRHCFRDWLLLEGHLQLGRSVFLSRLYRRLKPQKTVPELPVGFEDPLRRAEASRGGVWDLCDAAILLRQLQQPPSARFRAQLLSLALGPAARGSFAAGQASRSADGGVG